MSLSKEPQATQGQSNGAGPREVKQDSWEVSTAELPATIAQPGQPFSFWNPSQVPVPATGRPQAGDIFHDPPPFAIEHVEGQVKVTPATGAPAHPFVTPPLIRDIWQPLPTPPGVEVVVRHIPPMVSRKRLIRCQSFGCLQRFRREDAHIVDVALVIEDTVVAERTALCCSESCGKRLEGLWRGMADESTTGTVGA